MSGAVVELSERLFTNPFATRWVRPGAIEYRFEGSESIDSLIHQLRQNAWRGAIIGPHGTGKSTLVQTLLPALVAAGREPVTIQLRDGEMQNSLCANEISQAATRCQQVGVVVIVDGYEQLNWFARLRLHWQCRRASCGLIVTAHQRIWLPTLWQTQPTAEMVCKLVRSALPNHGNSISSDEIVNAYNRHRGNVRETFFELYDLFESRR